MAGTDPIHQFVIQDMFPIHLGGDGTAGSGLNFSFTNSSLFMVATVAVISLYLILTTSAKSVIPGRAQLVSELLYGFVANMFGMVPYFFTVTSHIIVTFALSMLVFLTVVIYGFVKNGPKFLKLFVPSGVPGYILPIVAPIEFISFMSRPISLSVRLFGNILAGHITLKVFTGFIVTMSSLGFLGILGSALPLIMAIALTGLEFLVGAVQAYVFAVLTCMYLNDAIHPSH